MALVNCRECNGQVSDLASKCIHCGAPLRTGNTLLSSNVFWVAIVVGLASIIAILGYKLTIPGKTSTYTDDYISADSAADMRPYSYQIESQSTVSGKGSKTEDERIYGIMVGREQIINRNLPHVINPMLKLDDVNYRHSTKQITYSYLVMREPLPMLSSPTLNERLQARYCSEEEFRLYRENGVSVRFSYVNRGGVKLHTYSTYECMDAGRPGY